MPLIDLGLIFYDEARALRILGRRRNLEVRFSRTRAQDHCGIAGGWLHVRLFRMTSGMRSRVIRLRI